MVIGCFFFWVKRFFDGYETNEDYFFNDDYQFEDVFFEDDDDNDDGISEEEFVDRDFDVDIDFEMELVVDLKRFLIDLFKFVRLVICFTAKRVKIVLDLIFIDFVLFLVLKAFGLIFFYSQVLQFLLFLLSFSIFST